MKQLVATAIMLSVFFALVACNRGSQANGTTPSESSNEEVELGHRDTASGDDVSDDSGPARVDTNSGEADITEEHDDEELSVDDEDGLDGEYEYEEEYENEYDDDEYEYEDEDEFEEDDDDLEE